MLLVLFVEATVRERVAGINSPVRTDRNAADVFEPPCGRVNLIAEVFLSANM